MAHLVLKPRHNLVGKSLLPMIMQFKATEDPTEIQNIPRLKKDHPLDKYTLEELSAEFSKLTGENLKDVLVLTGRDNNIENALQLCHQTFLFANLIGGPKGAALSDAASGSSDVANPGASGVSPLVSPEAGPSRRQTSQTKASSAQGGGDMESRLKKMEHSFSDMRHKQSTERVEESLKNVRILAGRPQLTSPSVLLASMEVLVESASKAAHEDTDFYRKALHACRQYENNPDICNLCLKLLGSNEDKKISSTIAEWMKTNKHESKMSEKEIPPQSVTISSVQQQPNVTAGYPPYQFPAPFMGYPGMPPFPGPFGFGPNRPKPRQRGRRSSSGVCFYCKTSGHFINECPKLKKRIDIHETGCYVF